MTSPAFFRRILLCLLVLVTTAGCAFQGLNSLPLPGTPGRGDDAVTYRVQIANVGTLERNSPVLLSDVVVGSVGNLSVQDWHAEVEVSLEPDVVVPANAVATVGQTSLLGSMHLALNPPPGQQPRGRLQPGAVLGLNTSSLYPSTERTLSSLSTLVNGGGLGQISDIVHESSIALFGREREVRDLVSRLDRLAGVLADQRWDVVATLEELERLSDTLATDSEAVDAALHKIPAALEVLVQQRPRFITALDRLRSFSDAAHQVIDDTREDLVRNLSNLEPTLRAVADLGPDLDTVLAYLTTFPFTQNVIDRGMKGDFMNLFVTLDLTYPRIRRTLALGTRWAEPRAPLVPAPGDPWYHNYTYEPLATGIDPQPSSRQPDPAAVPSPAVIGPVLPVTPPFEPQRTPGTPTDRVFAGPYPGGR